MNTELKNTIANAAVKLGLRAMCDADTVTPDLFMQVARQYQRIYGFVPTSWQPAVQRAESLASRFIVALIEEGHNPEDLALMSLVQLRDLYQDECIPVEDSVTITATASGGVSRKIAA